MLKQVSINQKMVAAQRAYGSGWMPWPDLAVVSAEVA